MPPLDVNNQPPRPAEDLNQPDLYQFSKPPVGGGFVQDQPNFYQFNRPSGGNGTIQDVRPAGYPARIGEAEIGEKLYMGPVGRDWGPRLGPSERRIESMPEGPQKQQALERETNLLYSVPSALKAYREDIKAADAIDQKDVIRRGNANLAAQKQLETQIQQAHAANVPANQLNALTQRQRDLRAELKDVNADYLAPATTRANAGFALISTGQDMLVEYGQNLVDEAVKLRPELAGNPYFGKALEAARKAAIANREGTANGGSSNPYQFTGDGNTPGGIPPRGPGAPGRPGRGPDGRALPNGNPGFPTIPGNDGPPANIPPQNQPPIRPFPQFQRGGETPDHARKDRPKPSQPVENLTPQPAQKPKDVDKGVWDQISDPQKALALALAAYMGYKLVQRGNRIAAERSRDQGNDSLAKSPENVAKLKEAIERAGQDFARDDVVKAEIVKEGEHAGKYEVTRPDGKKEYVSEAEFKERYKETGKPGEYKSSLPDRAKAVQLPDLAELNEALGLGKQADRKMWAVIENGEVKLFTDKEFKQNWRQPSEADKASWEKEADRKLTPEQRAEKEAARVAAEKEATEKEAARVAAEKEAARVAAEKEAAEKEAARVAAEKEAARVAAEKEAAEKEAARVAAEKEAARDAAEKEAARVAAEKEATEKEAARVAVEKEAARVAAEKEATEKEAARVAAEKEAARVTAEKEATEKEAARVAAEKEAARVAAEKEAARVAAEKEAARVAAEKEAAEKEAARVAAEKEAARVAAEREAAERAAAERFRPTTGTEILKGIKVGDTAEVEGAKWSAVGKVEDRVLVRKEGVVENGIVAQKYEPEKYNRVEIAGDNGIYFQRKGSDKIYKHSPVNSPEPIPGEASLVLANGILAKTPGSDIVKALRGDIKPSAGAAERPAAEPVKPDISKVKSPISDEKLKMFVDRVENGLTPENLIEELQTRSKDFFGQEGSDQFRDVVRRTKFAENADLKPGESKMVFRSGDQTFEPKSFEASPAPGHFVTADGKKIEVNDCRIEIQLGKGTTPEQAARESLLSYNRLSEQVSNAGETAGTEVKPSREAVDLKLAEALDVARGKIAPGGATPGGPEAIAVKLGDFEVGGKTVEVSLSVHGIKIGGKEFSSTEVVEMTMKETQKKMNEAKTETERKALADSLDELKKLHEDIRDGKPVEIAKLHENLAGNLKNSYDVLKAGERPGEAKPGEIGGRIKGGVGRAGAYLIVTAFVASLLIDGKKADAAPLNDYAPTRAR